MIVRTAIWLLAAILVGLIPYTGDLPNQSGIVLSRPMDRERLDRINRFISFAEAENAQLAPEQWREPWSWQAYHYAIEERSKILAGM